MIGFKPSESTSSIVLFHLRSNSTNSEESRKRAASTENFPTDAHAAHRIRRNSAPPNNINENITSTEQLRRRVDALEQQLSSLTKILNERERIEDVALHNSAFLRSSPPMSPSHSSQTLDQIDWTLFSSFD